MLANMVWCGWLNAFPLPNYEEPQLTTTTNSVTGASKSRGEASSLPYWFCTSPPHSEALGIVNETELTLYSDGNIILWMTSGYLSTEEVAQLLGYTRQHIGLLIRQGRLQGDRIGKSWAIPAVVVQEYKAKAQTLPLFSESRRGRPRRGITR